MRNARLARFLVPLILLLALSGCHNAAQTRQADQIQAVLDARAGAINGADQAAYLKTVLPSDEVLQKEESNLIRAAGALTVHDFRSRSSDVRTETDGRVTVMVTQSYTVGGESHRCAYRARFVSENGALYFDGPAFELKQNSQIRVYYMAGRETLAQQLLNEETNVLAEMKESLDFAPQGTISVKLYDDQQVFLQSVKLDLPDWVGGWHEYGEAIKSFTGAYGNDGNEYKSMLNHESTHRMVSELSNDNAAYWLQEGMAGVFQTALDSPKEAFLSQEEKSAALSGYTEQKQTNLEQLDMGDRDAVLRYYATSKAFAAFLLDRYGWPKVREALEYMKKDPLIPVTGAEKIDETNQRTDEAMKSVFGFQNDGEFQAAFDEWRKG